MMVVMVMVMVMVVVMVMVMVVVAAAVVVVVAVVVMVRVVMLVVVMVLDYGWWYNAGVAMSSVQHVCSVLTTYTTPDLLEYAIPCSLNFCCFHVA